MFQKVNEREWKGESEHYTLNVKKYGHVGYWMTLTNKATGAVSAPRYGKHFKALSSWVEKFEGWAREEEVQNTPCAWMDSIEAVQEVWELAA